MRSEIPRLRLVIADDHALVREGMRAMLAGEPDLVVIGEATDGREAVEVCRELRPDLVLMDVQMPEMDGLSATREINAECPKTAVLIVTTHASPEYLLEAVRAGAAGYVLKEATKAQLVDCVRRVLGGESLLDPELAMRLLRRLAAEVDQHPKPDSGELSDRREKHLAGSLTARETDVLRLLATGKTNRQIAQELHLSLSTIKGHLERIISKLGVSDRTQAAVRALELGLLPKGRE